MYDNEYEILATKINEFLKQLNIDRSIIREFDKIIYDNIKENQSSSKFLRKHERRLYNILKKLDAIPGALEKFKDIDYIFDCPFENFNDKDNRNLEYCTMILEKMFSMKMEKKSKDSFSSSLGNFDYDYDYDYSYGVSHDYLGSYDYDERANNHINTKVSLKKFKPVKGQKKDKSHLDIFVYEKIISKISNLKVSKIEKIIEYMKEAGLPEWYIRHMYQFSDTTKGPNDENKYYNKKRNIFDQIFNSLKKKYPNHYASIYRFVVGYVLGDPKLLDSYDSEMIYNELYPEIKREFNIKNKKGNNHLNDYDIDYETYDRQHYDMSPYSLEPISHNGYGKLPNLGRKTTTKFNLTQKQNKNHLNIFVDEKLISKISNLKLSKIEKIIEYMKEAGLPDWYINNMYQFSDTTKGPKEENKYYSKKRNIFDQIFNSLKKKYPNHYASIYRLVVGYVLGDSNLLDSYDSEMIYSELYPEIRREQMSQNLESDFPPIFQQGTSLERRFTPLNSHRNNGKNLFDKNSIDNKKLIKELMKKSISLYEKLVIYSENGKFYPPYIKDTIKLILNSEIDKDIEFELGVIRRSAPETYEEIMQICGLENSNHYDLENFDLVLCYYILSASSKQKGNIVQSGYLDLKDYPILEESFIALSMGDIEKRFYLMTYNTMELYIDKNNQKIISISINNEKLKFTKEEFAALLEEFQKENNRTFGYAENLSYEKK